MKNKLIIVFIILILCILISNFILAVSGLEQKVNHILKKYKKALNKKDKKILRKIGTKKFVSRTNDFLTKEIDSISVAFFNIENYHQIEEKIIKCDIGYRAIIKNNGTGDFTGSFSLTLKEINGSYYIIDTNFYDKLQLDGGFPFSTLLFFGLIIIGFWKLDEIIDKINYLKDDKINFI